MTKVDRLYLCNGKACEECSTECKHISDEKFAKNKCRRDRKWSAKVTPDRKIYFEEVEK